MIAVETDSFKNAIRQHLRNDSPVPLGEEVIEAYTELLVFARVKKKQLIVQPGFPCNQQTYVIEGAFRAFFIDQEGNEQTIQFAIDGWYISDADSYLTGESASLYIEALEDSLVAHIPKGAFETFCDQHPAMQKLYRVSMQRAYGSAQKRMVANLQRSAEFVQSFSKDQGRSVLKNGGSSAKNGCF